MKSWLLAAGLVASLARIPSCKPEAPPVEAPTGPQPPAGQVWLTEEQIKEAQKGRALWWDKGVRDLDAIQRDAESKVAPNAYYYDAN